MSDPDERTVNAKCLSVIEAAAYLGVSPKTVYRLVASGAIDFLHVGRRVVIPPAALDALRAPLTPPAPPEPARPSSFPRPRRGRQEVFRHVPPPST
jgi:excisionase family DNA binding protein